MSVKIFTPLHKQLHHFVLELHSFLSIAIAITKQVKSYHENNVIIEVLNTHNICWNGIFPITAQNISINLNKHAHTKMLESYQSPEQRKETGYEFDYRSDLYSLGIIFFELLTQSKPFYSLETGAELDCENNEAIPKSITLIIQKLLFTCPDHRYQTAQGLIIDLEKCLNQIEKTDSIDVFLPGQHDKRSTLVFGSFLYGRDNEQTLLLNTYKTIQSGHACCMSIQGHAGIGKTSLIIKTLSHKVSADGLFVSGKQDAIQQKSHESIKQALTTLINHLLKRYNNNINWKKKLTEALYPNGDLIRQFIPNLNQLIDTQQVLSSANIEQEKNRMSDGIKSLIRYITTKEKKPLVIFLDDLHHADHESLALIKDIIKTKIPYVFIITAYRNNNVSKNQSLNQLNTESHISIILKELSQKQIQNHMSDIFQMDLYQKELITFSELIYKKTNGNPFFIRQLLHHMKTKQLLIFNKSIQEWKWNIRELNKINVSDNVASTENTTIHTLPAQTKSILIKAACLGISFTLKELTIITNSIPTTIMLYLWYAENNGLIIQSCTTNTYKYNNETIQNYCYKFLHDTIQETAYSLMDKKQQSSTHWQIGQALYQEYSQSKIYETKILTIAAHLNKGIPYIQEKSQSKLLITINNEAAKKAKQHLAYQSMYNFIQNGIKQLPANHLLKPTTETFDYYRLNIQAHYLCEKPNHIPSLLKTIKNSNFSPIEKATIHTIYIEQLLDKGDLNDAMKIVLENLNDLDIYISKKPSKWYLLKQYLKLEWKLKYTHLDKLPTTTSPMPKVVIPLLVISIIIAHRKNNSLLLFSLILKIMTLSLNYGNNETSSYPYIAYAYCLSINKKGTKKSYELGCFAIKQLQNNNNIELTVRVNHIFESFINSWHQPFQDSANALNKNYTLALKAGDRYFAGFSLYISYILKLSIEMPSAKTPHQLIQIPTLKNYYQLLEAYKKLMSGVIPITQSSYIIKNDVACSQDNILKAFYYQLTQSIAFIHKDYSIAFKLYIKHEAIIKMNIIPSLYSNSVFYTFLSATQLISHKNLFKIIKYSSILYRLLTDMKKWSKLNKNNFYHRYLVMKAEWKRILKQPASALLLYQNALIAAEKSGFILDLAITHECLAGFYQLRNQPELEKKHILQAIHYYDNYGAYAKTKILKSTYQAIPC